jgi:phosphate transport system substrate-binding protein
VAVRSDLSGGVRLDWLPPTTSTAEIRQTGCDSMNMSMSYVYDNFTALYPGVHVILKGGGNNFGFAQWIAGASDVDQASRPINAEERQQATAKGINVTETKVGVECIAVVADPQSGVTELSYDQLRGLFNGSVTNWKDVGGSDLAVKAFMPRPVGSPYLFFNNTVMAGSSFSPSATVVENGSVLVDRVANTSGGVGFVRSGYLTGQNRDLSLDVKANATGTALSPLDLDKVYNVTYPLARYYSLYTNGTMQDGLGAWASFILDKDNGQRILADNGFLPLRDADRANSTLNIASTSSEPVLGYRIDRQASDGTVATYETNSTEFVDTNVSAGATYDYSVRAVYTSGEGQSSAPIKVSVPSTVTSSVPPVPNGGLDLNAVVIVVVGLAAVAIALVVSMRRR